MCSHHTSTCTRGLAHAPIRASFLYMIIQSASNPMQSVQHKQIYSHTFLYFLHDENKQLFPKWNNILHTSKYQRQLVTTPACVYKSSHLSHSNITHSILQLRYKYAIFFLALLMIFHKYYIATCQILNNKDANIINMYMYKIQQLCFTYIIRSLYLSHCKYF